MQDERPKNFIERLPPIIEREEEDISHLDPEMVEILYPNRADKTFTVTIVFGPPAPGGDDVDGAAEEYESAVAIAKASPTSSVSTSRVTSARGSLNAAIIASRSLIRV